MPRQLRIGALVALAAVLAGCGTKKSILDPAFTYPEGVRSSDVELITYSELPNVKYKMFDLGAVGSVQLPRVASDTAGVDTLVVDSLTGRPVQQAYFPTGQGHVRGIIFNRGPAEGMEIFRSESNGALRKLFPFPIQPTRRWLDGHAEVYIFTDPDPATSATATYYARGLIGGVASASSPISNASRPTYGLRPQDIRYIANRDGTRFNPQGGAAPPAESTFTMQWAPVQGTDHYWIQVFEYQPRILTLAQRIVLGAVSPIVSDAARDIFIASIASAAGNTMTYKLGDPGATILTYRTPHLRAEYFVRITAVDANGQMIGMTTGPTLNSSVDLRAIQDARDFFADFTDPEVAGSSPPEFLYYSRGAVRVSPGEDPNASLPQDFPQ